MEDFKIMARLLAAIRAGEESGFNAALVSERALKCAAAKRDNLALKLQRAGYVEGLFVVDDIDNMPPTILWDASGPSVTIEGLEFIASSKPLRKAGAELAAIAEGAAAAAVTASVSALFGEV